VADEPQTTEFQNCEHACRVCDHRFGQSVPFGVTCCGQPLTVVHVTPNTTENVEFIPRQATQLTLLGLNAHDGECVHAMFDFDFQEDPPLTITFHGHKKNDDGMFQLAWENYADLPAREIQALIDFLQSGMRMLAARK
jgi:hypothetical protein